MDYIEYRGSDPIPSRCIEHLYELLMNALKWNYNLDLSVILTYVPFTFWFRNVFFSAHGISALLFSCLRVDNMMSAVIVEYLNQ